MDFVEHDHAIGEAPHPDELVPYRKDREYRLIHRPDSIFGKKSPLLVGEPLSGTYTSVLPFIVNSRDAEFLEGIVEERGSVKQLQIEIAGPTVRLKEPQHSFEHRIAGRLGRKGDIEPTVAEPTLQLKMGIKGSLGFTLTHGSFYQNDRRFFELGDGLSERRLQRARRKIEDLAESLEFCRKRSSRLPAYFIQRALRIGSSLASPFREILTIDNGTEREPIFVGTDPVRETRETREQHEIRTGKRILDRFGIRSE